MSDEFLDKNAENLIFCDCEKTSYNDMEFIVIGTEKEIKFITKVGDKKLGISFPVPYEISVNGGIYANGTKKRFINLPEFKRSFRMGVCELYMQYLHEVKVIRHDRKKETTIN